MRQKNPAQTYKPLAQSARIGRDRLTVGSSGKPVLVTFSGLDGSGKSTQIANLLATLESQGCKPTLITFWDDVVVLKKYREGFVHAVFGSEQGVGAPGKPVNRRDKNMRGWYLAFARHLLYLLDALNLRRVVKRYRHDGIDVIVMDRYIYDELANLPLSRSFSRAFVRAIANIVPKPDVAFLLDADPEAARLRKPEYPADFMQECRGWYMRLASVLRIMTVIPPLPLDDAKRAVLSAATAMLDAKLRRNRELAQPDCETAA